ncbi:hypothetical protein KUTeg_003118 [Tegillarca granosa]|uniref:GST C-terminal domain-containing protein n=1 Tax=Tegillarca granosa TaxID=220873 RepID=A0ABQ9FQ22_TEGGR|nr:hypothetical protein KUTeg_003118 [Tegillarca granosa]
MKWTSVLCQMADHLKSRYNLLGDEICSSDMMVCSFLDQRYRALPFLTADQRQKVHSHVTETLTKLEQVTADDMSKFGDSAIREPNSVDVDNSYKCERGKLSQKEVSFLFGDLYEYDCSIVKPNSPEAEVDMYSKERQAPTYVNPFNC